MFVNEKYIEKMRIISHFAIAYLSISLYTPVFDSWIKERNAEVIGITSSQRFSSENRNMVILSPFAFLLYFPHFLFRDEF